MKCELTFMATTRCNNCKHFDECYSDWEKAKADNLRKEKQYKQEAWKDAMRTYLGRGRQSFGK